MFHMENVEKRVRTDGWMDMRLMVVQKMQAFSFGDATMTTTNRVRVFSILENREKYN